MTPTDIQTLVGVCFLCFSGVLGFGGFFCCFSLFFWWVFLGWLHIFSLHCLRISCTTLLTYTEKHIMLYFFWQKSVSNSKIHAGFINWKSTFCLNMSAFWTSIIFTYEVTLWTWLPLSLAEKKKKKKHQGKSWITSLITNNWSLRSILVSGRQKQHLQGWKTNLKSQVFCKNFTSL